jgi:hypothetical protein
MSENELHRWLANFPMDERLRSHVACVMNTLPAQVQADFTGDPGFAVADYEPGPGMVVRVAVGAPGRNRSGRAVVLKRTLGRRPPAFIRYVIAHELAHAHLRNRGRWPGDDPESAADALAAAWGFPKTHWDW